MGVLIQTTKNLLYRDLYDLIPFYLFPPLPNHATKPRPSSVRGKCRHFHQTRRITTAPPRQSDLTVNSTPVSPHHQSSLDARAKLPLACPGCGAPTQTIHQGSAGYYTTKRTAVRTFTSPRRAVEQEVVNHSLGNLPGSLRQKWGIDVLKGRNSLPLNMDAID